MFFHEKGSHIDNWALREIRLKGHRQKAQEVKCFYKDLCLASWLDILCWVKHMIPIPVFRSSPCFASIG